MIIEFARICLPMNIAKPKAPKFPKSRPIKLIPVSLGGGHKLPKIFEALPVLGAKAKLN